MCDAGSPQSASSTTVLTHVSPVLRISRRREQCNSNHVTGIGEISVTIRSLDRNITWSIQITHLCCCSHWDKSPDSVPFRSMYRGNTRCHMESPPLLWRDDNRLCRFWKGEVNQKTNDMVSEELQMRQLKGPRIDLANCTRTPTHIKPHAMIGSLLHTRTHLYV